MKIWIVMHEKSNMNYISLDMNKGYKFLSRYMNVN